MSLDTVTQRVADDDVIGTYLDLVALATAAMSVRLTNDTRSPATKAAVFLAKSVIDTSGESVFVTSNDDRIAARSFSSGAYRCRPIRTYYSE